MAYQQRGLDAKQEQNQRQIIRDTRPLGMRIADFMQNPRGVAYTLFGCAAITLIVGYVSELVLIAGLWAFIYCMTRKTTLPFRMPMRSHGKDYSDTHPKTRKPGVAKGIYYFGNEQKTDQEMWFSDSDMRTHVLIFGSTGSGKTEALVSLAYNALVQASGFIYVDGKGDNGLFAKIFSMCRSMGREDDLLLINFMTGARDIIGPQEKRLSNTLNPFARGSSSMLAQLVIGMMDSSASSADGDMWKGRAIAFVEALMKILVAMRDAGNILLDANTVRNYFHFPKLETMVVDKIFVREGQEAINLEGLPPSVMEGITNYVYTLPGFSIDKKGKQVSQVLEQHGFITMQLVKIFNSLADTYGHILRTKLAEVDLNDVVLNRRILCVLLPALEKSTDELSNLGKIIIATLRAMMAAGLGDQVEGDYADIIERKPTNSETPFLCILDEYGYYAVKGFAVVPAQARSLGFSVVFAGQDLPSFQRASKEEAASIGANTNIKICMKLEDPTETWDFFMKGAGESYVTHVDSFQIDGGSVLGNYNDAKGAKLEKRSRIDLQDLKEQNPGEAHFFFKSKIVRGRFFFANPKPVKRMRLNHYLKIEMPTDADVLKLKESFTNFKQLIDNVGTGLFDIDVMGEEVREINELLEQNADLSPLDRSVAALTHYLRRSEIPSDVLDENVSMFEEGGSPDHLDVFTQLNMNAHLDGLVMTNDMDKFKKPILNRSDVRDQTEYVQRLCGHTSQQAMNVALEVVSDMERGTTYPPQYRPTNSPEELTVRIENLIDKIKLKKQEAQSTTTN